MRAWTIKLFMVDDQGNEHPADCFNKVVYHLHPSFEQPMQSECSPSRSPSLPCGLLITRSLHETPLHLQQRGVGRVRDGHRLLLHGEDEAHP